MRSDWQRQRSVKLTVAFANFLITTKKPYLMPSLGCPSEIFWMKQNETHSVHMPVSFHQYSTLPLCTLFLLLFYSFWFDANACTISATYVTNWLCWLKKHLKKHQSSRHQNRPSYFLHLNQPVECCMFSAVHFPFQLYTKPVNSSTYSHSITDP